MTACNCSCWKVLHTWDRGSKLCRTSSNIRLSWMCFCAAELTDLRYLWLEGNPLSYAPFYRLDVLAWFDVTHLCLDGVSPKSSESTAVAMRATGEVPLAWHIMAQYVSQQQLLWRPKEASNPFIPSGVRWQASPVIYAWSQTPYPAQLRTAESHHISCLDTQNAV